MKKFLIIIIMMLLIINSLRISDKIYKDNLLYNNIELLGVLDKGIIKQLKTQVPTYNKTPPLETMGGVFAYMEKLRWTLYRQGGIVPSIALPRVLLDILSRGGGLGSNPNKHFCGLGGDAKIASV